MSKIGKNTFILKLSCMIFINYICEIFKIGTMLIDSPLWDPVKNDFGPFMAIAINFQLS